MTDLVPRQVDAFCGLWVCTNVGLKRMMDVPNILTAGEKSLSLVIDFVQGFTLF